MKLKSSVSVRPSFRACVLNDVQFEQGLTLVFIFFFVFSGLYIPVWTERRLNTAVRPVLVGFIPLIYTFNGYLPLSYPLVSLISDKMMC